MRILSILGSTGSIGRNTLKVVARFPDKFKVCVLTAKSNVDLLAEQIKAFNPEFVAVYDDQSADKLKKRLPKKHNVEILIGADGYRTAATIKRIDMVVAAMVGAAGLTPVLAAIAAGKDIALANKETLVMAGGLVTEAVKRQGVRLLPIDSEHSAIFQCLQGSRREELEKIYLTASGGPFLRTPAAQFNDILPEHALKHPNWDMGSKITIDSATLMNKGLELIEAKWLFNLTVDQVEVVVHPQSIVHSMVAYHDGSIIAQLGIPDMQTAIAYALSYPERLPLKQPLPDFFSLHSLTFEKPDESRFPALTLSKEAARTGGTLPAVMNAANEIAVNAFLTKKLSFSGIHHVVQTVMAEHNTQEKPGLDDILSADAWARDQAQRKVDEVGTISYHQSSPITS